MTTLDLFLTLAGLAVSCVACYSIGHSHGERQHRTLEAARRCQEWRDGYAEGLRMGKATAQTIPTHLPHHLN